MKHAPLIVILLLTGCVSVELPGGLVSDTVKAGKDVYRSATGDKPASATLAHSYVGKDNQTVADIKGACISEAAEKVAALAGKGLPYTVVENEISALAGKIVANCKLRVDA